MHIAHVRREPSLLESLNQDKERSNGRDAFLVWGGPSARISPREFRILRLNRTYVELQIFESIVTTVGLQHTFFSEDTMFKPSLSGSASMMELNILTA